MVKRKKQTSYFVMINTNDNLRIHNNLKRIYKYEYNSWSAFEDCPSVFINSIINRIDIWQQKENSVIFWCCEKHDFVEVLFDKKDLYNIGLVSDYFQLNLNPENKINMKFYDLDECNCIKRYNN